MKIRSVLSVASEVFPLIKTGGLADVTGALPGELGKLGIETKTLLPGYPQVMQAVDKWRTIRSLKDFFGGDAKLLAGRHATSGLELVAIDAPWLYDRPGNPYLDGAGKDWPDNQHRFAALAYAAALLCDDSADAPDLVHGHDWQAGLTALYLRERGLSQVPAVLTIHNIAFQGTFEPHHITDLRLPPDQFDVEGYEYHGKISMLKAGIYYSDKITTVSPTYAREIQTPEFGMGLEGLLRTRRHDLSGIVNGIATDIWDPANDTALSQTYDAGSLDRRAANKTALQQRFGLTAAPERPLFCIVSRLTHQKGMDLVLQSLDPLVAAGGQLALIGTGESAIEQAFVAAAGRHAGSVGCIIGYDEAISHQLQGGADATLVPSRFEPCGLTQLYGLRYGCVPIVARVGGLADTVIDANEAAILDGVATGIQLTAVDATALQAAIERAIALFARTEVWRAMQQRGMSRQLGWARAAQHYALTYQAALESRLPT